MGKKNKDSDAEGTEETPKKKRKKLKLLVLLSAIGGGLMFWKQKRDRELDEALWEEPSNL